jgi:hypothetical protein
MMAAPFLQQLLSFHDWNRQTLGRAISMPREAEGAVEGSSLVWRRFSQEELDETGEIQVEGGRSNRSSESMVICKKCRFCSITQVLRCVYWLDACWTCHMKKYIFVSYGMTSWLVRLLVWTAAEFQLEHETSLNIQILIFCLFGPISAMLSIETWKKIVTLQCCLMISLYSKVWYFSYLAPHRRPCPLYLSVLLLIS